MGRSHLLYVLVFGLLIALWTPTVYGVGVSYGGTASQLDVVTVVEGSVTYSDSNGTYSIADYVKAEFTLSFVNATHYRVVLKNVQVSLKTPPEAVLKVFRLGSIDVAKNRFIYDMRNITGLLMMEFRNNTVLNRVYGVQLSPTYRGVIEYLASEDYSELNRVETYASMITSPLALADTIIYSASLKYMKLVPTSYLAYQIWVYDTPEMLALTSLRSWIDDRYIYPVGIEVYGGVPLEHYRINYSHSYSLLSTGREITVKGDILTLPQGPVFLCNPVAYSIKVVVKTIDNNKVSGTWSIMLKGYMVTDYKKYLGDPTITTLLLGENGDKGYATLMTWGPGTEFSLNKDENTESYSVVMDGIGGAPAAVSVFIKNSTDYYISRNIDASGSGERVYDGINGFSNKTSTYSFALFSSATKIVFNTGSTRLLVVNLGQNTVDLNGFKKIGSITAAPPGSTTQTTQQPSTTTTSTESTGQQQESITTAPPQQSTTQSPPGGSTVSTPENKATTTTSTSSAQGQASELVNKLLSKENLPYLIIGLLIIVIVALALRKK